MPSIYEVVLLAGLLVLFANVVAFFVGFEILLGRLVKFAWRRASPRKGHVFRLDRALRDKPRKRETRIPRSVRAKALKRLNDRWKRLPSVLVDKVTSKPRRKRRTKAEMEASRAAGQYEQDRTNSVKSLPAGETTAVSPPIVPPVKRKPGRPRKVPVTTTDPKTANPVPQAVN